MVRLSNHRETRRHQKTRNFGFVFFDLNFGFGCINQHRKLINPYGAGFNLKAPTPRHNLRHLKIHRFSLKMVVRDPKTPQRKNVKFYIVKFVRSTLLGRKNVQFAEQMLRSVRLAELNEN